MIDANKQAAVINEQLKKSDVQLCFYAARKIIKKGNAVTVDGNCIRVNGRGPAMIAGTFKAYSA